MTKTCLKCSKKFKAVIKWANYCSAKCEVEASKIVPKRIKKET